MMCFSSLSENLRTSLPSSPILEMKKQVFIISGLTSGCSLFHRRFADGLELRIQGVAFGLRSGGLDEVEVEELFEHVQQPFCLPRLDILDSASVCRLQGVRG